MKYECFDCFQISDYDRDEDKICEVCHICGWLVWLHKCPNQESK